ncbi:TonB-linked outer membrane protein, SusC/RagA family [bacterium A37T11]|nr:TonB-linked outer membrane protein, SusC/RagA family [bacterium A37T11]
MQIFTLSYWGRLIKTLLVMKLSLLLIFLACFKVSASVHAQTITLNEKNAPLAKIFKQIEKQSGYSFFYKNDLLKNTALVTIHIDHVSLSEALDKCFAGQPLIYEIVDNTIIVKAKEKSLLPKGKRMSNPSQKIIGKVTDTTGTYLMGASISIQGKAERFTTGPNGEFSFEAETGDLVTVSFVGFTPYLFTVSENMPFQDIVLHQLNNKLNEVAIVATGYQNISKERVTGSFVQPIKEMYRQRVSTDLISKLSGITSGLVFNSNTSAAANGYDINIRGRNTIFANDQPLIIVDNFPYSGDISDINPNDYDEPTILRDAAAASIWGVRAGNGVIVFTSKKGRANQQLKVSFNANLTVSGRPDLKYNPNQLDASSYIDMEGFLFKNGFYDGSLSNTSSYPVISPAVELFAANPTDLDKQLDKLKNYNINDQLSKYFYQKAVNQQYALNLSGGSDKAIYYFSAGYDKDLPTQKTNTFQRITLNSQNSFYPAKGLEINTGIYFIQGINKGGSNLLALSNTLFPYSQVADANGSALPIVYGYRQSYVQSASENGFLDWKYYPLNELGATDNTVKNLNIRLNTALKYKFIQGFSGEIRYQYQRGNVQSSIYNSQDTYYTRNLINMFSNVIDGKVNGYNIPLGGILNQGNSNSIAQNFRGQLNFDRSFGDHSLTILAGYELSQTTSEGNSSVLYGYNNDLATFTNIDAVNYFPINPTGGYSQINSGLSVNGTLVRIRSTFANALYSYKNRYYISGSSRIDGTNYFGVSTNQKNVPLWSIGGKWDISKEKFYHLSWVPTLSFRGSYGYNGNMDYSVTGMTTFQYYSNARYTGLNYVMISNIGNPDLRWEKTGITNFAIDFSTQDNILSGSLEYFIKKETDILGDRLFPSNSGITSLRGNYSDMKGRGFDITLTSNNLRGAFKWNTTVLFSHATDKVTKYDIEPYTTALVSADGNMTGASPVVGKPVFGLYGFKWAGLDHGTGNPYGYINGEQSQDYNSILNNTPLTDLIYAGPARPTYFGAINNRFSYRGLSLAVQISYKIGYYFRKPTINYSKMAISSGDAFLYVNRDINARWLQTTGKGKYRQGIEKKMKVSRAASPR